MKKSSLCWVPRVFLILFIIFLSLFALDIFAEQRTVLEKITGFLVHLIPSFSLTAVLLLAWKRPVVGGVILLAVGLAFTFWFNTYRSIISFALISLPVILAGVFFILCNKNHLTKKQ